MYDSRFHGALQLSLQKQLALIYRSLIIQEEDGEEVDPQIPVRVPTVQPQRGTNDCGIFAIAFALHAAIGDDFEAISFDQSKMRSHLLFCFKKKQLIPFPQKNVVRNRKHFPYCQIELHCTCLLPEEGDMVECDHCDKWYHTGCVGLLTLPTTEEWTCPPCSRETETVVDST